MGANAETESELERTADVINNRRLQQSASSTIDVFKKGGLGARFANRAIARTAPADPPFHLSRPF
jgi:hypothetical protein